MNPNQPPEDLYVNTGRFELGRYPSIDEKAQIIGSAIQGSSTSSKNSTIQVSEALEELTHLMRFRRLLFTINRLINTAPLEYESGSVIRGAGYEAIEILISPL